MHKKAQITNLPNNSCISFQETKDEDLEKLVQAHCRLDLTAPMPGCTGNHQRNLLFEGDLKLKEGTSSKVSFSQSQG